MLLAVYRRCVWYARRIGGERLTFVMSWRQALFLRAGPPLGHEHCGECQLWAGDNGNKPYAAGAVRAALAVWLGLVTLCANEYGDRNEWEFIYIP